VKVVLISDTGGLGLMDARPEPVWRVRFSALRNKDLLAPDYGMMHVAAAMKASGRDFEVVNLVADLHRDASLFMEPGKDPAEMSGSLIRDLERGAESRSYLFDSLENLSPDVVMMPLSNYSLALYARRLFGEVKDACPGATLVTGGIYSTMNASAVLEDGHADFVVRGEGEVACVELLDSIERGRGGEGVDGVSGRDGGRAWHNPARPPNGDLDSLPHLYTVSEEFDVATRFELLRQANPWDDYIPGAGFLTSRGCPESCKFCLDPALNNGRVRFHSPGYVREVLAYCNDNFGGGGFFFGDATFTMNRKRLLRLLDEIRPFPYRYQVQTRADQLDPEIVGLLADARVTGVAIGAESFNDDVLREADGKRLDSDTIIEAATAVKGAGMTPLLTFIVGLPGETRDSVWRTVEILERNDILSAAFFPLVVFKGTELFDGFEKRFSGGDREKLRVNPHSEEFLCAGDEFETRDDLTGFTDEINEAIASIKAGRE
jgi:radical SAM superfamily enzyme YgiQ (UPF0313 family)